VPGLAGWNKIRGDNRDPVFKWIGGPPFSGIKKIGIDQRNLDEFATDSEKALYKSVSGAFAREAGECEINDVEPGKESGDNSSEDGFVPIQERVTAKTTPRPIPA